MNKVKFPSPRGDKLQRRATANEIKVLQGFRPLAGISCNSKTV